MGIAEKEEGRRRKSVVMDIISDSPKNKIAENLVVSKEKEETRCKKMMVLVKPSVHEKAKKKCASMGISLNECINQMLENWI